MTEQSSPVERRWHVEVLSPRQDALDLEARLEQFAARFRQVTEAGWTVCIPDNPLGKLAFQGTELIQELDLHPGPGHVSIHLNTFHTKADVDEILTTAVRLHIDNVLVISGDGSERLPKLRGAELGMDGNTVTSVELVAYVQREYPGLFRVGVAFNPYEPQDHELEKMQRKKDAGAEFITTQPLIGPHPAMAALARFRIPIIVEAWMSRKLHLLNDCIGYEVAQDAEYDPIANLRTLMAQYPGSGYYLSIIGFKTQFPQIRELATSC